MKLISVYSAAGLLEADILKAFLEAQGFQVFLSQESVGRTLGLSAGTLGMVDIMVPEEQVSEVKTILAEMAAGGFDDSEFGENLDDPSFQDSNL